jgi:hypothetical protein
MFATSQIREHMEIVGSDGGHVGTVDHMEGDEQIKLARRDSKDNHHHFLAIHLVDRVDDKVHLKIGSDQAPSQFL